MLYLTCTMIYSVDLAYYEVSHAKDQVSVNCGTTFLKKQFSSSSELLSNNSLLELSILSYFWHIIEHLEYS